MLSDFITAVRTLTILPVPGRDTGRLASSLPWFPVVGLLLGGLLYLAAARTGETWSGGTAMLVVALGAVLTRGLHMDGLADCADGFGGGHSRERALEIMKDPHVGAFGVSALVLVILAKWIAVEQLIASGNAVWIVMAYVVSRAMQVELAVCLPYARDEGTASAFVRDAEPMHRIVALMIAFVVSAVLGRWAGVGIFFVAWLVCRVFGACCRRKVGGVTGDLLGACSEGIETLVLFLPGMI